MRETTVTILEALRDEKLLGAALGDAEKWRTWRAFLAAAFGLPMPDAEALALFRECTGRTNPPTRQVEEAWCVVGRRGGKSRVSALIAVYLALFRDHASILAPGERGRVPVIAADRKQAGVVFGYIGGILHASPLLEKCIVNESADCFELDNGINIEVFAASFRNVRGYTVVAAVMDEIAFWRVEDSAVPDHEILNALRPAMATVPGAMLVGISSPYARRGVLWEAYRRYYGKEDPSALVWQAATRTMHPAVPQRLIDRALEEDPEKASAEYLGIFRRDVSVFIPPEALDACVVPDRGDLGALRDVQYFGFCDPSGGSQDSMTLAIAHAEGERVVVDAVLERRPPFSPATVVEEFTTALKCYDVGAVMGDRYAGDWVREPFGKHGVAYAPCEVPKSDLYRDLLPVITTGRIDIPDHKRLVAQLLGLERRTSRAGKDSIDHAPGGHDDLANVIAGVTAMVLGGISAGSILGGNLGEPRGRADYARDPKERWEEEVDGPYDGR